MSNLLCRGRVDVWKLLSWSLEAHTVYCVWRQSECERGAVYSLGVFVHAHSYSLYTYSAGYHKQSNHNNEVTLFHYFGRDHIDTRFTWLDTHTHTYLMALFSRQRGTNGIGHLRIELLRLERWNLRSFWSRVMDLCGSETTQMKGFVTNITSVVWSSSVHRDKAYRPYPVGVP